MTDWLEYDDKIAQNVALVVVTDSPAPPEGSDSHTLLSKMVSAVENVDMSRIMFVSVLPEPRPIRSKPPGKKEMDGALPTLYAFLDKFYTSRKGTDLPVIVSVGSATTFSLIGTKSITHSRGIPVDLKVYTKKRTKKDVAAGVPEPIDYQHLSAFQVIPIINPSAVLQGQDKYEKVIKEDLTTAWNFATNPRTDYAEHYTWMGTSHLEAIAYLDSVLARYESGEISHWSLDLETMGLIMYDKSKEIICLACCDTPGKAVVIPLVHMDCPWSNDEYVKLAIVAALKRVCEKVPTYGWNFKFDYKWLFVKYGIDTKYIEMDGLLARHWMTSGQKLVNDLNTVAANELGFWGHGRKRKEILRKLPEHQRDDRFVPVPMLLKYAGGDADATLQLGRLLKEKLVSMGWYEYYKAKMLDGIRTTAWMEMDGVSVDLAMTDYLRMTYPNDLEPLRVKVENSPWAIGAAKVLSELSTPLSFSLGSAESLRELLYGQMKLPVLKRSKETDEPSADKEALTALLDYCEQFDHDDMADIITTILEWRTLNKRYVTYIKNMPVICAHDGKFHTNYKLDGTVTGRMSSSEPSLHTIPKGTNIRLQFVSEWKKQGGVILSLDAAQAEMRVAASLANDPGLIEAISSGQDMHAITASKVFKIPVEQVTKDQRTLAKTVSFACVPMNTTALTRHGWKTVHQLVVGEEVLGYDEHSGTMKWTPITSVVTYSNAPLMSLKTDYWEVVTTPNHRWYGDRRTGRGRTRRIVKESGFTSEDITREHRIFRSALLDSKSTVALSNDDCELLGWLLGDGSFKGEVFTGRTSQSNGRKVGLRAGVKQIKKSGVVKLNSLISRFDVHPGDKQFKWWGGWLRIPPNIARRILGSAGLSTTKSKITYEQLHSLLCSMSVEQVRRFLHGIISSEGTKTGSTFTISQNEGPIHQAILLASFLAGYTPSNTAPAISKYTGLTNYDVRLCKPIVTGQRLEKSYAGHAPVWCLSTALGSWVMRQGDSITITGNTLYGATARRVSRTAGVSESEAQAVIDSFFKAYPGLLTWMQEQWTFAKKNGFVMTPFGRIRWIDDLRNAEWGGRAWRTAVNGPIQSTASDLTYSALVKVVDELRSMGCRSKPFGFIHDSIIIDTAPNEWWTVYKTVRKHMVDGTAEFDFMRVPFEMDCELCPGWGFPLSAKFELTHCGLTVKGEPQNIDKFRRELKCLDSTILSEKKDIDKSGKPMVELKVEVLPPNDSADFIHGPGLIML